MMLHTTTKVQTVVLLKTAQATVSSYFNDAEANILFDEGAQRSFITKELAEKLNIVPESTVEMSIIFV
ncbi:hypothetical protein DPMN_171474 [Dreissena polymorpha]|uniref:Peptidase aspartic putative domain-containing protein n=1 Tax=Dreissena polymorpha TaxID=45954 RepID=A0A9D4DZ02_DREPO|nr:hypothetical protein DPMN_171474 [Dreissena polymorpha]